MDFSCEVNNTMEEPIKIESWEKFEEELVRINKRTKVLKQERKLDSPDYPLYRGISDSRHHLESTLDRIRKGMYLSEYREIIKSVYKHVATCTGGKWNLETEEPKVFAGRIFDLPIPTYEFMAYLRHNEFPSPLIDWTKSPYIAAYFAFRKIRPETEYVSIFVHMGKYFCGQQLCIGLMGPTIATDRKHYLQRSEYSICFNHQGKEICFANHEDVVKDGEGKDILIKYKIPVSERQKFLGKLDSMNITAYSLFGSEPSLMETLALREIILEQKNVF